MSPRTARERLKAYLVRNPTATAPQAAAALGVSRQRIHAIAKEEALELGQPAAARSRADLGTELAPPPLTGRVSTKAFGNPLHVGIMRVAADLMERGYDVFLPAPGATSSVLVAFDPGTFRFEAVDVELHRKSPRPVSYEEEHTLLRRAIVLPDQSIEYRPRFTA